jgi:hypothetical protein
MNPLSTVKIRLFTYRKQAARVDTSPLSKYMGIGTLVLPLLDELTGSRRKMSITREKCSKLSEHLLGQHILNPLFWPENHNYGLRIFIKKFTPKC